MNEAVSIRQIPPFLLMLVVGVLLGLVYFGALWWTVRRLPEARNPWLLYFASLVVRLLLVVCGFFAVLRLTDGPRLFACLFGFVGARLIMTYGLGPKATADSGLASAGTPSGRASTAQMSSGQISPTPPQPGSSRRMAE